MSESKDTPRRPRRRSSTPAARTATDEKPAESSLDEAGSEAFDATEELAKIDSLSVLGIDNSLAERISWVRRNLPDIKKDKEVGTGNFKYGVVTHENINKFLRPLMVKAGLIDSMSLVWITTTDTGKKQGAKELPVIRYHGFYDYQVRDVGNKEYITQRVDGQGEDAGDKGPGKARTYAFKGGRTTIFSIAAGENEEGRLPEAELTEPTLSAEQFSAITEKADDLFGDDGPDKLQGMCEKLFKVDALVNLPAKYTDAAMAALENRRKMLDGGDTPVGSDDIPESE